MKSKKAAQLRHARARARLRYGIGFGDIANREVVQIIQTGDKHNTLPLEKQSNRVTMFAIKYQDEWIPVVYDNKSKVVVSFLPKEALADRMDKIRKCWPSHPITKELS
jgi:hypothetical protein